LITVGVYVILVVVVRVAMLIVVVYWLGQTSAQLSLCNVGVAKNLQFLLDNPKGGTYSQ
jgi:hypothetical protein